MNEQKKTTEKTSRVFTVTVVEDTQRYRAPALDKGLDIIELLAGKSEGLTRSEIVKELDRKPGEIYRMLDRLVEREYVYRSSPGGSYYLSMKLFLLGSCYPPVQRLVSRASAGLNAFAKQARQSIHMVIPDSGRCVVVAQASGEATWQFMLPVGSQLDLTTTGSGLALLAFQNEATQIGLLSGSNKSIDSAISAALKEIKTQGFRIAGSQQLAGVTDLTVPVLGPDNNAVAVLTCPYMEYVHDANSTDQALNIRSTLSLLRELGSELSYQQLNKPAASTL